MPNLNPYDYPQTKCEINGVLSPGILTVEGGEDVYTFQSVKGLDSAGSRKTYKGRELSSATLTFQLFTAEDRADWQRFIAAIKYDENAKKTSIKGYQISHPILESNPNVKSWLITKIAYPKPDARGVWIAVIEIEEDRLPKEVKIEVLGTTQPKVKPPTKQEALNAALQERLKAAEAERALKESERDAKEKAGQAALGQAFL